MKCSLLRYAVDWPSKDLFTNTHLLSIVRAFVCTIYVSYVCKQMGLNVQNLPNYNQFYTHFSIHVDPLKSLIFNGISLEPEIFTK